MSRTSADHMILALLCQIICENPDDFAKIDVAEADRLSKGWSEIEKPADPGPMNQQQIEAAREDLAQQMRQLVARVL